MTNSRPFNIGYWFSITCLKISFFWCFAISSYGQNILINEFMASNSTVIADEFGEYDDWVELYNPTFTPIDIGGMFITDDLANPTDWMIPTTDPASTTIPANGYLLLWLDKDIQQGVLHVDSKLSSNGEEIGLFAADGTLIDSRTFGIQQTDISEGRTPNGDINWGFFSFPTPLAANTTNSGSVKADTPIANLQSGLYESTQIVTLSSTTPNAIIYYTLDGSVPTDTSSQYTSPLSISINTPLRAVAVAPDYDASVPATYNYLIDVEHTFPVVTITVDDSIMFDPVHGMYTNFWEDIEVPAHVELIETDGTIGFSQIAEMEVQGSGSAEFPQKSLGFKAKSSLGNNKFEYPVFPDLELEEYRSLIVRNSGQDRNVTMFRDAFATSLVRDLSDVGEMIQPPKLYTQGYRPGVVYINGEYWGIYNIRERMDKRYLKTHFDLDEEDVDMIEGFDEAVLGDNVDWNNLIDFFNNTDLSIDANFDSLKLRMDTEHYLDYIVFNVFIDNWDWPDNNNKRWRERSPDGKWRFLSHDHDFTFGLFTPQGFNSGVWFNNSLGRLFQAWNTSWPNSNWSTLAFRKMILNEKWKNKFINRMADQINVLYNTERLNERIDTFQSLYEPEMQQQIDRWTVGFIPWEENVDKLRMFSDNRVDVVREHVVAAFNHVWGSREVTLDAIPQEGGKINFSTITVDEAAFPWTGVYFTNNEIPITAEANPGFEFTGWSVTSGNIPIDDKTIVTSDVTIYANFSPITNQLQQTIAFLDIPDKYVPELPFTISATASSGLTVTYSILSGPASISGNTITLDGIPGTVVVQAEQSGDSTYLPITVTQSFEVLPQMSQTIDFNSIPDQWTNNPPFQIQAEASSGMLVNLFIVSGPATINGNTITLNGTEGTVVVQAEQSGSLTYLPAPIVTQSFEVSAQQVQQVINFTSIPDKNINDIPFGVFATASSNLPVSFNIVSGPAIISGNIITLDGVEGTVAIEAIQNGNTTFLPAPSVIQSFEVVTQVSQAISFPNIPNKWTTDIPFQISASASSGLPVSLSIASGPATISGDTITLDGTEGFVHVVAEQVGNFNFLPAPVVIRSFEVTTPQSQAISFTEIPDKWTTDMPFEVEATSNSGLPVSINIILGPASISNNTITLDGTIGTVYIQAEQNGNGTYLPAPIITQSFEVMMPASQTIDFSLISNKWTTDVPFDVQATASSGLPVEFNILSGPATINGNTITLDGVEGEVVVEAEQNGAPGFFPAPSVMQSFNVLLETSIFDPSDELDILLNTYPNPFEKIIVADYTLNHTERLEVSIVNVNGIQLFQKIWEHPTLQDQLIIDTSEFPTGIYALIFKQGNEQKVIRVTKVNSN